MLYKIHRFDFEGEFLFQFESEVRPQVRDTIEYRGKNYFVETRGRFHVNDVVEYIRLEATETECPTMDS